jgi:hypothetical protein
VSCKSSRLVSPTSVATSPSLLVQTLSSVNGGSAYQGIGLFSLVTNMPLSSGFMFSMIGSIMSMASSVSIAPSSRTCVIRLSTLPGWMLINGQRLQRVSPRLLLTFQR